MNYGKSLLSTLGLWRLTHGKTMHAPKIKSLKIRCYLCGNKEFTYEEGTTLRESACTKCGASIRNSDVAYAICKLFKLKNSNLEDSIDFLSDKHIYEPQSSGPIHELLKFSSNYTCSEYFDGIKPGRIHPISKIRCEDLQNLSFPDQSFDLVITQDILEHIADPKKGFKEINRVLKTKGAHIFTVPMHEGRKTISRMKIVLGRKIFILPPIYHGDPLREKGSLVFTDFGDDLFNYLGSKKGIKPSIIVRREFYDKQNITWTNNFLGYIKYLKARKLYGITNNFKHILNFFKYNSIVFCVSKNS